MKIILFLLVGLSISISSHCQNIKESSFDKFLKKYRIQTNDITIDTKLTSVLTMAIKSIDSEIFIKFSGRGYPIENIGSSEKVILLLSDDSTITLNSIGVQTYDRNGGSYGTDKVFHYEYYSKKEDIEKLAVSELAGVRIYFGGNYSDIEIKSKKHNSIYKLCEIFLREFNKNIKQ